MPDSHNGTELTTLRLGMLAKGYHPVPVSGPECRCKTPGKQPLIPDWRTVCKTADPDLIREWTEAERNSTNTGILAGEVAGIDIDVPVPELADELEDLGREMLGETPLWRVGSPPKRLAVYRIDKPFGKLMTPELFMPDGTKVQVEILADGQQFVAFGTHPGDGTPKSRRPYQWRDRTPLDVPADKLPAIDGDTARQFIAAADQLLRQAGAVPRVKEPAKHTKPDQEPPGSRANRLSQGKVEGESYFHAVNRVALTNIEAWVRHLFPTASRQDGTGAWRVTSKDLGRDLQEDLSIHPSGIQDFGSEEPQTAINLVLRSDKARDPVTAAHWLCDQLGISPRDHGWSEPGTTREPRAKEQTTHPPDPARPDTSGSVDLYELLDIDGMAALPDPDWLIEDMVPATAMTLIFGGSDAFKSFLALDMALSVATGRKWQGRDVRQGPVIYIASEGAIGVGKKRVRGWLEHYGMEGKPPIYLLRQEVLMNDPAAFKKLTDTIDAKLGGKLALIVCDVLSGTRKGSEVDDEGAADHVRALQTLVRTYGASVVSLTHTGWADSERARGHTHTWGSYDTRLKVEGDKDRMMTTLTINRHKDSDAGPPMTFDLVPVPVPGMTKRNGEPETTLVPVWSAESEPVGKRKAGQKALPPPAKTVLNQLRNAVIDAGTAPPPHMKDIPQSVLVVSRDLLRQRCISAGISGDDTTPAARRQAFKRGVDVLKGRDIMAEWEGLVWLVKDEGQSVTGVT
jgi:hypothetical protein